VKPVGADDERPVDVRVVAATRDDLDALVATGAFRPDLSYRISVLKIVIPPLRARREDIRILVETMMKRSGLEAGEIRGENLDRLLVHDWPGNVRELRNAVERATALSPRAASFAELSLSLTPMAGSDPLSIRTDLPFTEAKQEIVSAFELRYLRDLFTRCDGNVAATAREAQMDRKHLRSLLEKHGLL
jgi:DNA-binding NtrC family response regulator